MVGWLFSAGSRDRGEQDPRKTCSYSLFMFILTLGCEISLSSEGHLHSFKPAESMFLTLGLYLGEKNARSVCSVSLLHLRAHSHLLGLLQSILIQLKGLYTVGGSTCQKQHRV